MTRSILSGLLGLLSVVAMASLPSACESGGVGDPCLPEEEYDPQFAGFKVTEENIESRSFQCQTRICLVNHFQGRVSCPLGQEAPKGCNPDGDANCSQQDCQESGTYAPDCDPADPNSCVRGTCNAEGSFCGCETAADCPGSAEDGWHCREGVCKLFLCRAGFTGCQDPTKSAAENEGKSCCVPGTENPVAAPVCGQCAANSDRNAEQAVYCSCRCGPAEGDEDPNFNFCECPQGFECREIRPNIGFGDAKITGKYCIKQGSMFENEQSCGKVQGRYNSEQCEGTP
ncbi:hypothetical protein SOCEGT47_026230 [Sorangium cellulosum]|uniref:Secreted protein n=1 Tax=Sorangium cellulosum TaxID=56 RepID=A0A4V0NDB8_SORCE|nr:hypothetical protein [Sorangium cellulosum]AUX22122.1 hypothetical protein SOCEGT47_026230 [Sorangium cellulosum]